MRERIMDDYVVSNVPYTTTYYHAGGGVCTVESGSKTMVNGSYSAITDEGSKWTDEVRTRYLDHHRSSIQSFPTKFSGTFNSGLCGPGTVWIQECRTGDPGYYTKGNPWILDGNAVSTALHNAFRFFEAGCVEQKTLLANFAWELPDVRTLWPSFKALVAPRKSGERNLLKFLRREAKTASSSYLAYEFGVLPLIGDLMHCYEQLQKLDDHIAWLRKNSGQKTKVVYHESLPKPTASSLPELPTSAPSGGGFYRNITELRSGFKAWAVITYDVSALTDLQLKTRTLLRAFGLNNPAAVIWEGIPYSFVFDWVMTIGELLGRLEVPIVLPNIIHDCGYGVWIESVFEDWYITADNQNQLLRRTTTRGYSRRPGLPITISGLSLETPSAKQLVLGLALLGQKVL